MSVITFKGHESRVLVFVCRKDGLKVVLLPTSDGHYKALGGTNREEAYHKETERQTGQREVLEESGLKIIFTDMIRLCEPVIHPKHGHKINYFIVMPGKFTGMLRTQDLQDGTDILKPPVECTVSFALRNIISHHREFLRLALEKLASDYPDAAMALY